MVWGIVLIIAWSLLEYSKMKVLEKHKSVDLVKIVTRNQKIFDVLAILGICVIFCIRYVQFDFIYDKVLLETAFNYIGSVIPMLLVVSLFANDALVKRIKEKYGDNIAKHKFWSGFLLVANGFPWRTFSYSSYLLILVLGQAIELNLITITDTYFLDWLNYNKYSILLLIAIDRVINSVGRERKQIDEIKKNYNEMYMHTLEPPQRSHKKKNKNKKVKKK